jgi:serine protease inhibitor
MKANSNVVLSPFSLSMAMGMLQQGTLGQTEKDIGSTLFNGLSKENVAKKFKQLKQVNFKQYFSSLKSTNFFWISSPWI